MQGNGWKRETEVQNICYEKEVEVKRRKKEKVEKSGKDGIIRKNENKINSNNNGNGNKR